MRDRLPMHLVNGASVALGVALTQALFQFAHSPRAAALAMTGAICASLADQPLRPERTWRRVAAGALAGLAAAALMLTLRDGPWATGLGIGAVVFVAMMMLGWGPRAGPASFAAVLSVVFTMGLPHDEPVDEVVLWQAAGAALYLAWAWLSSMALQPRYRRLALAAALQASAELLQARAALVLRAAAGADEDQLRGWIRAEARLAERLQAARDLLFAARPQPAQQRQVAALLRLIDLRDLLLASALELDRFGGTDAVEALRRSCAERLQRLADALIDTRATLLGTDTPQRGAGGPLLEAAPGVAATLVRAMDVRLARLADEARRIDALVRGADEPVLLDATQLQQFVAPEGWPLKALRPHAKLASPVLRHALRAGAALAATFGIAHLLPWAAHPQWLVLSVAVVLRNTYDQTVARRNLRVGGTVLGCLLVLGLSHIDSPQLLALVFVAAIGLAHGFSVERYLFTAMAGTVMALLQAHLVAPTAGFPIAERVADTVIGAALAWAFSYVLPSWERRSLPTAIARVLDALRAYAAQVLVSSDAPAVEQRLARRHAYDTLGALSASLQRSAAEPARVRPDLRPPAALLDQAQRLMAHLSMVRLLLVRAEARHVGPALADTAGAVAAALASPIRAPAQPPADTEGLDPPEHEPQADSVQPWLLWRLRVTRANAAEVRRAAAQALAALRPGPLP